MKKTVLFILSLVIGLALFTGVVAYIGLDEIISAFKSFPWWVIAVTTVLAFVQIFITIFRWKIILNAQGDKVPFVKLISPKFVGYSISFLTPGLYVGGEPVRAYVLKKETGIPFTRSMASIIVDKILDFTYPLPFLIGALVFAVFNYDMPWSVLGVFILTLFILIGLLGLFYFQTLRGKGFFSIIFRIFQLHRFKFMRKVVTKMVVFEQLIITFFKDKKQLFAQGLLLSLLGGTIIFLQFFIILYALGIDANFLEILVMMVFMILSFLIPIPASLGSLETGQVVVFTALKFTASIGIAFTLVLRVAEIFKVGLGLIYLSRLGLKLLKAVPMENGNNNGMEKMIEYQNKEDSKKNEKTN